MSYNPTQRIHYFHLVLSFPLFPPPLLPVSTTCEDLQCQGNKGVQFIVLQSKVAPMVQPPKIGVTKRIKTRVYEMRRGRFRNS
jgi:hypothetical protein